MEVFKRIQSTDPNPHALVALRWANQVWFVITQLRHMLVMNSGAERGDR